MTTKLTLTVEKSVIERAKAYAKTVSYTHLDVYKRQPEIRDTTLEWISWIIPLLIVELVFSWIPSMKRKQTTLK